MRYRILVLAILAGACAKAEEAAVDSPATAAVVPATISLADVAGKWTATARPESADTTVVNYEIMATADPSMWTITLPGRPAMPLRVTTDGDSIMLTNGPYESVLRKGVQVSTESVMRLVDGKLVGTTIAHYATAAADSVVRLRVEATRAP